MRQREHETQYTNEITYDRYPEIDDFIPLASRKADSHFPDKSIPDYKNKWSQFFCATMDKVLKDAGLRF